MGKCDDESAACKQDMKDYDEAKFARGTAEQQINRLTGDVSEAESALAAAGATAGFGVAVMWGAGWTGVGAVVGGLVGVGGGVAFLRLSFKVRGLKDKRDQARKDCDNARVKMKSAYDKSLTDCKDGDCRPSADIPACP